MEVEWHFFASSVRLNTIGVIVKFHALHRQVVSHQALHSRSQDMPIYTLHCQKSQVVGS